jgi:hypothetical protein
MGKQAFERAVTVVLPDDAWENTGPESRPAWARGLKREYILTMTPYCT